MQVILNLMRHSVGSQCNCLSKPADFVNLRLEPQMTNRAAASLPGFAHWCFIKCWDTSIRFTNFNENFRGPHSKLCHMFSCENDLELLSISHKLLGPSCLEGWSWHCIPYLFLCACVYIVRPVSAAVPGGRSVTASCTPLHVVNDGPPRTPTTCYSLRLLL